MAVKFCPECGSNVEGMKFCGNCGTTINQEGSAAVATETAPPAASANEEQALLKFSTYMYGLEGKADSFVNIPQMHYELTTERLKMIKQGMVSKKQDEMELYKVKDILVHQKMKDKLMKVGDIEVLSADESTPSLLMKRIKNPQDVKEAIRNAAKAAKKEAGVAYRHNI